MQLAMMWIAEAVPELPSEAGRLQHNYEFLSYGLTAAWIILMVYVLFLVSRWRKLKRELQRVKALLEERQKA